MRRVSLIAISIGEIFNHLPPETSGMPAKEDLDRVAIQLHANIINTYGVLDCWAHVWVNEWKVLDSDGKKLHPSRIGLGKKYKQVRQSLTPELKEYLKTREDWIVRVSNLRHAVAHSIPPYIPPHCVDPAHSREYEVLLVQWYRSLDKNERCAIERKMESLAHFKALVIHDIEKSPPIFLHSQIIIDFLTIEELANKFMKEIYEKRKGRA